MGSDQPLSSLNFPQEPQRPETPQVQSQEEIRVERQKIRRLQIMVNMVMQVISQDPHLSIDEASEMVADTRRAALALFPEKELAYDLLYRPRLQRLMRERYRIQ